MSPPPSMGSNDHGSSPTTTVANCRLRVLFLILLPLLSLWNVMLSKDVSPVQFDSDVMGLDQPLFMTASTVRREESNNHQQQQNQLHNRNASNDTSSVAGKLSIAVRANGNETMVLTLDGKGNMTTSSSLNVEEEQETLKVENKSIQTEVSYIDNQKNKTLSLETTGVVEDLSANKISTMITNHTAATTSTSRSSNTKIIGFSDNSYMRVALKWYRELDKMGYTEHMVVAQDKEAAAFFASKGMRHEWIHERDFGISGRHNFSNFRQEVCGSYDSKFSVEKQLQNYRRSLFGSRWTYVLRQLEQGTHVLLTDVDNVFVRFQDLSELEQSPFDSYHAYAGTVPSFPKKVFQEIGFTICGGMSWLRASPGVIEITRTLVEKCGCMSTLHCHCSCDDQVVFNNIMLVHEPYKIIWDQNVSVPASEEEMRWEGMTGTCSKTGHRVKIWDRHTAFRREFDPNACPDKDKNWIAMPIFKNMNKAKVWKKWREVCGTTTTSVDKNNQTAS